MPIVTFHNRPKHTVAITRDEHPLGSLLPRYEFNHESMFSNSEPTTTSTFSFRSQVFVSESHKKRDLLEWSRGCDKKFLLPLDLVPQTILHT